MKKLTILVAIAIILALAYGIPRIMTKTEDESVTLSSSSDYTTYTTKPITTTTIKVIETTAKKTTSAIPKTTEVTTTAQTTVATTATTAATTTAATTMTQKVEQPIELNKINLGEFKLTAYCSCQKCCGKWALNRPVDENGDEIVIGSTGNRLTAGLSIAVDPKVIPYGSKVEIYGNTYIAHDTGGAIKGNRIDVYFDSHEAALQFGVKHTEVFLLNGES